MRRITWFDPSIDASLNALTGMTLTNNADEFHLQGPKYNHSMQNKSHKMCIDPIFR